MKENTHTLETFRRLVTCVHNLYFTEFDLDLCPVYCSAPYGNILFLMLSIDRLQTLDEIVLLPQKLNLSNKQIPSLPRPILHFNSLGMVWSVETELLKGCPQKIHVMGPMFTDDFSPKLIRNRLDRLQLSVSLKQEFLAFLEELPVISMSQMTEYAIMQHFALTGEQIGMDDLRQENNPIGCSWTLTDQETENELPHGTYAAEKQLLDMVRAGDIHYKKQLNHLAFTGSVGKMAHKDPLRQAKNSIISFTTLCSRAAIEGGLSPQSALLLSDRYIQQGEQAATLSELTEISHAMLDTYVRQVHRIKNSRLSPQIQQVCNRLHLHPEAKLDIHAFAEELGYSDYYFTRKFKREVGMSIKEYVLKQKIETAKQLLIDTSLSIAQISDRLNICSQSYFGDLFRKKVGISPLEYREKGC